MWTILIKPFLFLDCRITPWTVCVFQRLQMQNIADLQSWKATTGETQQNRHRVWHYCTLFTVSLKATQIKAVQMDQENTTVSKESEI